MGGNMEEKKGKIVCNAFQTPDGTVLHSKHRHDYVTHEDENGAHYMLDGGNDYVRSSTTINVKWLTVYADDSIELIREVTGRSGYGIPETDDYGRYRCALLKDMSDDWVEASIDYLGDNVEYLKEIYRRELEYRKENPEYSIKDGKSIEFESWEEAFKRSSHLNPEGE